MFKLLHRYDCQKDASSMKCLKIFAKLTPAFCDIPHLLKFAEIYDLTVVWDRCMQQVMSRRQKAPECDCEFKGKFRFYCAVCVVHIGSRKATNGGQQELDGPQWTNLAKERPDIILKALKWAVKESQKD